MMLAQPPAQIPGGYPGSVQTATFSGEGSTSSGWVWKRKNQEAKGRLSRLSRFLNQFNQRYLTVDFKKEQFFYSHSSDLKKVSAPISFDDLLSAYAVSSPEAGRSVMGTMSRMLDDAGEHSNGPSTENGICVQTRQKEFELYFLNSKDAYRWLQVFERAIYIAEIRQDAQARNATKASAPALNRIASDTTERSSGTETVATPSTAATSGEATPIGPLDENVHFLESTPQNSPGPATSTQPFAADRVDLADGAEVLETTSSKDSAVSVEGFHLGWESDSVNRLGWDSFPPPEELDGLEPPESTASLLTEKDCSDHPAGMTDRLAAVDVSDHGDSAALVPPEHAENVESAAIAIVANSAADEDDAPVQNVRHPNPYYATVIRKPSWNYASQRSWED